MDFNKYKTALKWPVMNGKYPNENWYYRGKRLSETPDFLFHTDYYEIGDKLISKAESAKFENGDVYQSNDINVIPDLPGSGAKQKDDSPSFWFQ